MAVVPNLWGVEHPVYRAPPAPTVVLGPHGALLPILLAPLGLAVAGLLHFPASALLSRIWPVAAPVALIAYYFAWK